MNKLSRALDNLQLACESLVRQGVLRAVKRTIINPLNCPARPMLGLKIVRYGRDDGVWTADVLLTLVTMAGQGDDEANIDLAAQVDQAVDALARSGQAGAVIDSPTWEPWEWRPKDDGPLMPVGSVGALRMRVDDPLLL